MTRQILIALVASLALALTACGADTAPPATAQKDATPDKEAAAAEGVAHTPARPGTLFRVDYRIVGTPVVGSPVAIDLEIETPVGDEPVNIGFQVPDSSGLVLDEAQPRMLTRTPEAGERRIRERITVIPQREGRLYVNVSASRSVDDGSASTVISIPIHVGEVDTSLQEHGRLETDEEGETTRVLTSE